MGVLRGSVRIFSGQDQDSGDIVEEPENADHIGINTTEQIIPQKNRSWVASPSQR